MYYTKEGTPVSRRIQKERTKIFELDQRDQARAHAKKIRSYVYDLYLETRRVTKHHCGYAVPN